MIVFSGNKNTEKLIKHQKQTRMVTDAATYQG